MTRTNLKQGALAAAGAALAFAITGALIKEVATELNNPMVVFLRNLFGLLFLLPWLIRGGARRLSTRRLPLHMLRVCIGLTAMYCFFYALANLPLAKAVLLNYATPLYVPLIAWLWLREQPPPALWLLVLAGLLGVGLILKPETSGGFSPAALIGAAAGVFAATAFTAIRRLSSSEPPIRIVFYFTVGALLVSALPLPLFWEYPSLLGLGLMALVGISATIGQFLLTRAYSLAPAAQIAPFNYLVVVWASALGWLLWRETPDLWSALGASIVIASSLLVLQLRQAGANS